MNPELQAFKDEWEAGNRWNAVQKAHAYVELHRGEIAPHLERYTREELVDLVSAYRNAGREEDRIVADMWLLTEYDPQRISGIVHKELDPDELLRVIRSKNNGGV